MMPTTSGAMSDDASSGSNGSNGGGGNGGMALKKGPWTAAEDAILIEYVQKHGEGNWNAVQKNSGLSRCGKSCRLRWANHLRPNLKKGSFSPEEERLILELHAKLGNKWARMAAQLPGRTDNEIKNYWNTRVKRRQRAGLPLYPQDMQKQPSSFSFHQNNHHQSRSHPNLSSMSSSSSQHPKSNYMSPMSMFDPVSFSSAAPLLSQPNNSSYLSMPVQGGFKRFRVNNGFSPTFSTQTPPLSSSSSLFTSPSFSSLFPSANYQFDSNNLDFSAPNMLQNSYESNGLISSGSTFSVKTELPSNQMSMPQSTGQTNDNRHAPSLTRTNSGLLDALLQEAEDMGGKEHLRHEGLMHSQYQKGGGLDEFLNCAPHRGSVFSNNNTPTPPLRGGSPWDEDSTAQSSAGVVVKKEPSLDINNAVEEDDDLSSLLNSIPATNMMVSDLYRHDGAETSNGQSSVTDEDISLDIRNLTSATVAATNSSIEPEWSLGAWNDLSGMSC